jgi:hypothetical protein
MHCDSRLCSTCTDRKKGQNIEKYRSAVFEMDSPMMWTLTVENVADPISGQESMVEDLATLRRRTVPLEGSTTREASDGEGTVTKEWCWWSGTKVEDVSEDCTQWKVQLQANGQHDLVRRLEKQFVHYQWEDITGTHTGKNIPLTELIDGGLYGVDVKQKGPFEYDVHAHVLVDSAFIPQAALSSLWEDITGDPVVDVRRIYDRSSRESVAEALEETVGYATKPPEFEEIDDELDFTEGVKGCPSTHPFGSLHGAGNTEVGSLICSNCERQPFSWNHVGVVDERIDNMGKGWEDRGKDPP